MVPLRLYGQDVCLQAHTPRFHRIRRKSLLSFPFRKQMAAQMGQKTAYPYVDGQIGRNDRVGKEIRQQRHIRRLGHRSYERALRQIHALPMLR